MGAGQTTHTWLLYLGDDECDDLLASSSLGRLAVIIDGRPRIFPVNHVYDVAERAVLFPTSEGSKLHSALNWPFVAYEVDGIDLVAEEGWSVMVVGRAEEVHDPDVIARAHARRTAVWRPGGEHAHWVRIVPEQITGRRIGISDGPRR
jgi:uncharacterized protein